MLILHALAQNTVNLLEPLGRSATNMTKTADINSYIATVFPIFLAAAISLAIVYIAWGGLQHMLSNIPGIKTEGSNKIKNALWGLVIALAAWIILQTINPKIVNDQNNKVLNPAVYVQLEKYA